MYSCIYRYLYIYLYIYIYIYTQLLYIVKSIARQKQNSSDSTFKTAPESHNDDE